MKGKKRSSRRPPAQAPTSQELADLVGRAKQGNASVLPAIRKLLDDRPEVWEHLGDAARYVEAAWLDALAGDNLLARESIKRQAAQMRQELAGPNATRAETMMADLATNNWLEVQHAQHTQATAGGGSLMQANHRLRRGESAQRRFLSALKTLVALRALVPQGLAPLAAKQEPGAGKKLRIFPADERQRLRA